MNTASPQSKKSIFKAGSTTYFYSSLFFPQEVWQKVATLYAYVRVVDDYVDDTPQDISSFKKAREDTYSAWEGNQVEDEIIADLVSLAKQTGMKRAWIEAFLTSMEMDLTKKKYQTFKDLLVYTYGSAAVIGLMMARILDLPQKSLQAAEKQGHAMQLINFIRDIAEDCSLGRQYLPEQDLQRFGVTTICQRPESREQRQSFAAMIRFEIERYRKLQQEAEQGYTYIPYRYLIPVATAASLYNWTAHIIYNNPEIVFDRKVKPSKLRVIMTAIKMAWKWRRA